MRNDDESRIQQNDRYDTGMNMGKSQSPYPTAHSSDAENNYLVIRGQEGNGLRFVHLAGMVYLMPA